jgi:hypothetical protein
MPDMNNAPVNSSDNHENEDIISDTDAFNEDSAIHLPPADNSDDLLFFLIFLAHIFNRIALVPEHIRFLFDFDMDTSQEPIEDPITCENHNLLEKMEIPDDWIPDQFKCPITALLIDGTPVVAPTTPHRFNHQALLKWLAINHKNPVNRDNLYPDMLKPDYLLECKIKVFIEWVCANRMALKSLSPLDAKQEVMLQVEKIEHIYEKQFNNHQSLILYTGQIIQAINEKAMFCESSKALILHSKEAKCFKPMVSFKLNSSPNPFRFYKPTNSQSLGLQQQDKYNEFGNCYEILNIAETATKREIITAYRKLSLSVHPDKNPSAAAVEKFKLLTLAKDILMNEERKNLHDAQFLSLFSQHRVI